MSWLGKIFGSSTVIKWILLLLAIPSLSFADVERTFTWARPNERTDNTPITDGELREYNIYCDNNPNPVWVQPKSSTNNEQWVAPIGTFSSGDHACQVSAVDTDGQESGLSNTVTFTVETIVDTAPPNVPRRFNLED